MNLGRLFCVFISLLVGVCAFAQEGEEGAEATKLEIILKEYGFQIEGQEKNATLTLEVGKSYALEFKNTDVLDHEVLWGRTPIVTATGAVEDYETNMLSSVPVVVEGKGWEVVAPGLTEVEIKAGQELELILTIPEAVKGEWEMGCFVAGHHEAGMHAVLVVE